MKLKALLLALAVAGGAAAFGLTDTGRSDTGTTTAATTTTSGTTTTSRAGKDCRRFELHGTLASVSSQAFSVAVTKGDKAAKGATGTTVALVVTADTRVSWSGQGTMTGPNVGDSVQVNGQQCGGSTGALTALKVEARAPKADKAPKSEHHDGSHK
jgi:hypothetical protein